MPIFSLYIFERVSFSPCNFLLTNTTDKHLKCVRLNYWILYKRNIRKLYAEYLINKKLLKLQIYSVENVRFSIIFSLKLTHYSAWTRKLILFIYSKIWNQNVSELLADEMLNKFLIESLYLNISLFFSRKLDYEA